MEKSSDRFKLTLSSVTHAVIDVLVQEDLPPVFMLCNYGETGNRDATIRRISEVIAILSAVKLIERSTYRVYSVTEIGQEYFNLLKKMERPRSDVEFAQHVRSCFAQNDRRVNRNHYKKNSRKRSEEKTTLSKSYHDTTCEILKYLEKPMFKKQPSRRSNRCMYSVLAVLRAIKAVAEVKNGQRKDIKRGHLYECLSCIYFNKSTKETEWAFKMSESEVQSQEDTPASEVQSQEDSSVSEVQSQEDQSSPQTSEIEFDPFFGSEEVFGPDFNFDLGLEFNFQDGGKVDDDDEDDWDVYFQFE
jgi:hypothetical protein